tara:strand:- start:909 stop:1523 length:615 start_codon:yes stop_codon:yes gene_type:complete
MLTKISERSVVKAPENGDLKSKGRAKPSTFKEHAPLSVEDMYQIALDRLDIDTDHGTITRKQNKHMSKSYAGRSAIKHGARGSVYVTVSINGELRKLSPQKLIYLKHYGELPSGNLGALNGDRSDMSVYNLVPNSELYEIEYIQYENRWENKKEDIKTARIHSTSGMVDAINILLSTSVSGSTIAVKSIKGCGNRGNWKSGMIT